MISFVPEYFYVYMESVGNCTEISFVTIERAVVEEGHIESFLKIMQRPEQHS